MPDDSPERGSSDEARMELEPDALHERENGYFLDCPECGSPVSLIQVIEEGRCTGYLDADVTEGEGDDEELQEPPCTAVLSLDLVWQS